VQIISGEADHNISAKLKPVITTTRTHPDKKGNSLSPLVFCIAVIALTRDLNRVDYGSYVNGIEKNAVSY
jgi:hypothetical protein